MPSPQVYVACLAAYNNGHLHGKWIDCTDAEEISVSIKDILANSPIPGAEEWAIHDFEGFGSLQIGEYDPIDTIAEIAAAIAEHGEIITAILDWRGGTVDQAIETLQDNYCGEYKSEVDFAVTHHLDCGTEIPNWLENYIDWEAIARDMFIDGYHSIELDGSTHVFYDH